MPTTGDVFGDRYRLDNRIASGGMGDVWRATDTVLGRGVAVKLLDVRRADDPGFQTRFRHEARAMAMLHHPGVADVYDYGETDQGRTAYIVMAYIDGQPLNQRIAGAGRLTPAETMSIVAQAARALHAAHAAGIVHRDVKPGNLIVRSDDTVVLVDFGVARSAGSTAVTGVNEVVGTALYIAPEQVSKDETGPATDIYALGALAYHCLAGHPPFPGNNPIAVAMSHLNDEPPPLPADVPAPVCELVTTAMAKVPAERFPTAVAMAEAASSAAGAGSAGAGSAGAGSAGALAGDAGAGSADDARTVAMAGLAGTATMPIGAASATGTDSTAPVPAGPPPGVPDGQPGARRPSRRAMAWTLALLGLAAAVALALTVPGLLTPGPADVPGPAPSRPTGSPGAGPAEEPETTAEEPTPGQPAPAPTQASAEPAESDPPASDPTEPEPDPTEPADDPTEPADDPTEPTQPTQPAQSPRAQTRPTPVDLGVIGVR